MATKQITDPQRQPSWKHHHNVIIGWQYINHECLKKIVTRLDFIEKRFDSINDRFESLDRKISSFDHNLQYQFNTVEFLQIDVSKLKSDMAIVKSLQNNARDWDLDAAWKCLESLESPQVSQKID